MAVTASSIKNVREELYIGPRIPQGLTAAIEGLTKEIIRQRPEDIYIFAANHFEKLLEIRKQYDETNKVKSPSRNEEHKRAKEIEKLTKQKLCDCKKKSRSQEALSFKSSGWSLNETAKVLKRHRNIFGDDGKKMSLDEIYDLANSNKNIEKLSSKYNDLKDQMQKTKVQKKSSKEEDKGDYSKRQSGEKKNKSENKSRQTSSSQKKKISEETHYDQTKKTQNNKIESFESSTKISNIQEINYSSQTSKLSIEEMKSSSFVQKIYQTIHETTSVMEEKVQKQFSGRIQRSASNNCTQTDDLQSNLSNKLSKSTTCLASSVDGSKSKAEAFENKLKETQKLLEKISTNFNQTMRRSMSAKDLRRVAEFGESKTTESSSSASKLRQISLPTVRPFSATKSDNQRKQSLIEANGLTLPIISQRSNKNTKQTDSDLTLPILSPSNSLSKSASDESRSSKAENQDQSFTVIKDIDKQVINVMENVKSYDTECKQSLNITEKITEIKSSNAEQKESDKAASDTKKNVALNKSSSATVEKQDKVSKSKSTSTESKENLQTDIKSSVSAERSKELKTSSEIKETKKTDRTKSSSSTERSSAERLDKSSVDKGKVVLKKSESAKSLPDSGNKNKSSKGKLTRVKSEGYDEKSKSSKMSLRIKAELEELDRQIQIKKHKCPSSDCTKGLNNDLLRSKLEELVRAEESILNETTELTSETEERVSTETEKSTLTKSQTEVKGEFKSVEIKEKQEETSSDRSSSEKKDIKRSVAEDKEMKQNSNDDLTKSQTDEDIYSYILSEGSPCEIPDTVTTVIFPDNSPNADDIEIKIDDINHDLLTNVFGEPVHYEQNDYDAIINVDFMKGLKNVHDISMLRQDLHRIKEEEEEEEENDISANEDSTIVLDKILEHQDLEDTQKIKEEKESDMSLQEFLLHCTLNESTEETSINDTADDAAMPFVPELNLQVIEDATESTSKTGRQKSDGERSIDEIENSLLQSERTSTSINDLQGITHESLSGDQLLTTHDESSMALDSNLIDSAKSIPSFKPLDATLIHAVLTIQRYYRKYKKSKESKSMIDKKIESSSSKISSETHVENKTSATKEIKTVHKEEHSQESKSAKSSKDIMHTEELHEKQEELKRSATSLNELADAVLKIQKCYRRYKLKKNAETKDNQVTTAKTSLEQKQESFEKKSAIASLSEMINAAVTIQKCYRKYMSRKHTETSVIVKEIKLDSSEKESSQKADTNAIKQESNETESTKVSHEKVIKDETKGQTLTDKVKGERELISSVSKEISMELQQHAELELMKQQEEMKAKEEMKLEEKKEKKIEEKQIEEKQVVLEKNKSLKESTSKTTFGEMVWAATTIQKCYRKYKLKKLELSKETKADNMPSTSMQLQHTGEFHDCIPLSVLDSIPKLTKVEKLSQRSGNSSTDHKRTRREWNQNPPLSPSVLYNVGLAEGISNNESTIPEESTETGDNYPTDRYPGVMIYADSLKNNFKHSAPQRSVDSDAQKFMNFVLIAGDKTPILPSSYINLKEQLEFAHPRESEVIIEEISNDEE